MKLARLVGIAKVMPSWCSIMKKRGYYQGDKRTMLDSIKKLKSKIETKIEQLRKQIGLIQMEIVQKMDVYNTKLEQLLELDYSLDQLMKSSIEMKANSNQYVNRLSLLTNNKTELLPPFLLLCLAPTYEIPCVLNASLTFQCSLPLKYPVQYSHDLTDYAYAYIHPQQLIFAGTDSLSNPDAFIVLLSDCSITKLPPFSIQRVSHKISFLEGYPTIIGGADTQISIGSVEQYKNEKWKLKSSLIQPRDSFAVTYTITSTWVFGGKFRTLGEITYLDSIEQYSKGAWTIVKFTLTEPLANAGLVSSEDGCFLVLGGEISVNVFSDCVYSVKLESIQKLKSLDLPASFPGNYWIHSHRRLLALSSTLDSISYKV